MEEKEPDTFLSYTNASLTDYLQMKMNFHSEAHQEYSKEYNKIGRKYPKVIDALENEENLEDYEFTNEEIKAILKLRKLEFDVRAFENEICFRLGINEILKFKV